MSDKKIYASESVGSNLINEVTGTVVGNKFLIDTNSSKTSYSIRTDETTTANTIYVGYAAIGSAESGSVWKIFKILDSSGNLTITYADGDAEFDNIWDNRASLTYS